MAAQRLLSTVRQLSLPAVIVVLLVCRGWSAEPEQRATSGETTAAKLVRAALEYEVAGNNERHDALLRQALSDSPNDASANWQLGRLCVSGAWQSPAEVERAAQKDKRLTQYGRLRDATGPTAVADQAALARWCRKNRMEDEQRVHWQIVLRLQPDNAEAIAALKLQPYFGTLMTPAQIQQAKKQIREMAKAADGWRPLVAQWHSAAERGNAALPIAVREKLGKIFDEAEALGLERALWQQVSAKRQRRVYQSMLLALMPALGANPQPAAAASLVRYAVFADLDDVRVAAVAGLKRHPLDHYAMLLLGGLQSPLEGRAWVDGLSMCCSVYQEGALADVSFSYRLAVSSGVLYSHHGVIVNPDEAALVLVHQARNGTRDANALITIGAGNAQREAASCELNRVASDFRDAVEHANKVICQQNVRITTVLHQLTGFDGGDEPMDWWRWWWQDYNEMYNVSSGGETDPYNRTYDHPAKPVYNCQTWREYVSVTPCSCFAPGTKVWTLTGRQPIEKIKVGDRVLAQDVESGELAYKPVLAVTTRPAGPWTKIGLGAESLTTTPSHPFWVAGEGWRMTKQLKAGNRVHSLSGGVLVENVETLDTDPLSVTAARTNPAMAYNLIVADYHNYLVGDKGILSHDNTPRMPTAAILPGLVRQEASP